MCNEVRRLTVASVFQGLTRELRLLAPVYEQRRPESLSAYSTLRRLLRQLTREAEPGDTVKPALVCSVLIAHQSAPHRLWAAILLRTFRPMLRHVFKKLRGDDREERLALLLTSFQETIRRVDPCRDPVRIAMYIRQETRRRVFAALGEQRDWEEVGFGVDADETPDGGGEARATASEEVRDMPDLELLQTWTEYGALREWVQREIPGPESEKRRTYNRLRRRRHRLVLLLRNRSLTMQEAP